MPDQKSGHVDVGHGTFSERVSTKQNAKLSQKVVVQRSGISNEAVQGETLREEAAIYGHEIYQETDNSTGY